MTDVVVVEPRPVPGGAPTPAVVATRDAFGNIQQRVVSPEQVDAVRASALLFSDASARAALVTTHPRLHAAHLLPHSCAHALRDRC
jgi:hypothetical protein